MPIDLKCSGCGQALRVNDASAGKQARCPECGAITLVPSQSADVGAFDADEPVAPQRQEALSSETSSPFSPSQNPFADSAENSSNPYRSPTAVGSGSQSYSKPHRGGLVLTLGIMGLVCCGFLGIAAWVMGRQDLHEMRIGLMDPSGHGMTKAGMVIGIISTCLMVISVLLQVGLVFVGNM